MCGRAGLTVAQSDVRSHVLAAGIKVNSNTPGPYRTATTKNAKERDTYPCVVLDNDELTLETRTFGVRRLSCHCIFDDWMSKPTWRTAAEKADGRCAVVVTSFVEGVTARRPDADVFFVLGLKIGCDEFVILTTDAKQTALLSERAIKSDGFGSNRCPLYANGAQASAWVAASACEAPDQIASKIDQATRLNELGLVLGAPKKQVVAPAGQPSIMSLWGSSTSKKRATPPEQHSASKKPRTEDLTLPNLEPTSAEDWSCKMCTLLNAPDLSICAACGGRR